MIRVPVAVAVLAAAGVVAATPGPRAPVSRLANYPADPPRPQYDAPVADAALRRAAALIPNRPSARYYVAASAAQPVRYGNVHAAMRLYALPALPVRRVGDAGWILAYRTPLPALPRRLRTYRLALGITLVEVAQ